VIELATILVVAAIFVGVPLFITVTVSRMLSTRDRRASNARMEELELKRQELDNRRLELEIRRAAYDLAQKQLEAGEHPRSLFPDV
jgi:hypothetical protein